MGEQLPHRGGSDRTVSQLIQDPVNAVVHLQASTLDQQGERGGRRENFGQRRQVVTGMIRDGFLRPLPGQPADGAFEDDLPAQAYCQNGTWKCPVVDGGLQRRLYRIVHSHPYDLA